MDPKELTGKSSAELKALANDTRAEADKLRLEYSDEFAGKADLDEKQAAKAAELRVKVLDLDSRVKRFEDEALIAPQAEEEVKADAALVESNPLLRYITQGWKGCSEAELKEHGGAARDNLGGQRGFIPQLDRGKPGAVTGGNSGDTAGVFGVTTEQDVQDALSYFGGIMEAASIYNVGNGESHRVPRHDSTGQMGVRINENTQASTLDYPEFGSVLVEPATYTSRKMVVAKQYLQDARVDVIGRMTKDLFRRIGRVMNEEFTNTPSGTDIKPQGLADASMAGITAASRTAITWQELKDLINSIDISYMKGMEDMAGQGLRRSPVEGRAGFMCHQNILNEICKLVDSDGRPILPAAAMSGVGSPFAVTFWGFPFIVNNDLPASFAAGGVPILFGDFSQFRVTKVSGADEVLRLAGDTHGAAYQVALVAFSRATATMVGRSEAVRRLTMAA